MKKMKRWASVLLILCMLLAGTPAPAESSGAFTATPTAEQSAEPTNTVTAEPTNTATAEPENTATTEPENTATTEPENTATAEPENTATTEPENTATAEPENTATAEPTNTATTEPENTATAEPENTATAEPENTATTEPENTATTEPENTATAEPENTATTEPTNTATAEPENTATAEPTNTTTAEPTDTPSPVPTDAAEVKTIASFEAVAPEGFAVPQGTPETGLGLPASLNVQFADGAAGEVAVMWQCAAGYDPNADAGAQFTFAAVLPEGYALLEGVSLPEILVTLTLPLANTMLMAARSIPGLDWTYEASTNTLTISTAGTVKSSELRDNSVPLSGLVININTGCCFVNDATLTNCTINVSNGQFINQGGAKTEGCAITVESGQKLENQGTISGGSLIIKSNSVENTGTITDCAITSGASSDWINNGEISGGTLTMTAGDFDNSGSIIDCDIDVNIGGDFSNLSGATISGGTLTITAGDFNNRGSISDCDIDVNTGGSFENNSGATISGGTLDIIRSGGLCTNSGTITGEITVSIQSGELTTYGTISGGKYTIETGCTLNNYNTISGGTFSGNGRICWYDSTISGGTFNCVLDGGASSNTGIVSKAHINGDIHYGGIFENTCIFGDGAYVWNDFQGTIKLSVTADGKTKDINYGANVLQSLDTPSEGKGWALAADGQTTLVGANDTMPLLRNGEKRTYVLINLTNINDLEIAAIDSQTYTGAAITPGVTITDGDKQLAAGTDYTVAYKDNINVGTATATITGIGLYTGSVEKTFQINKAKAPKIIWPTASSITYGQTLADSTLTSADAHGTFDWEDKTIAPEVGAHGYNVIYTPSDTENYDYTDVTRIQQVSITVTAKNIADESIAATIPEQTYTGETRTPEVAVTDGAHTLAANTDYTVAYSNNINAGTATATLTGMGNYTGTRTVKFQITAQAASLNVLSAERTWSKDMSLDESALRALFTVNDASGKALDGGLYTITVTKDGATASLPIEDAGAYTVKVTLTTGNYALAEDSFPYTIAKLPFTGTVSMAGYVYEGTASQPVLNGYDGDGEVTFLYRAQGGDAWQEWPEDITGVSLVPGNYEIKASVAATQNYAGGDTAAASFTVSPAKLGVSIEMPDYTYGGTVPTPALTPETSGLTVAWFYKGADGEEHPWENITGTTLTAGGYTIIARIEASALYEAAELTSTFTVNKAAAPKIDWPEVTQGIVYGQKVADIALSATEDGYGAFAWQNPDAILNAGEQTATLVYAPRDTANYDYTGVDLTREIAISVAPRDVYTLAAAPIPAQTYTGGPIYPVVSLWHGETKLVMGVDYTLSYQDNVNVGVGIITVAGMGNYAGTRLLFFDIVPPRAEEEEKPSGGSGGSTGNGGETAESTGEAQQDRLVVDTTGAAMPYTYSTVEELEETTGAVLARTLVIVADPVRDETGAIVYDADGQPLYEARSLLLSRELLDAIAERGYTHIRFVVKDAALEWPLASMTEDNYVVRLAPLEEKELSQAEKDAIGEVETLTGSYRARVTAVIKGEEVDVTNAIPSLTAIFGAQSVRELTDGETAQLLLVPGDGEMEAQVAAAQYIEETQAEEARYEAPLWESGLFMLTLQ